MVKNVKPRWWPRNGYDGKNCKNDNSGGFVLPSPRFGSLLELLLFNLCH